MHSVMVYILFSRWLHAFCDGIHNESPLFSRWLHAFCDGIHNEDDAERAADFGYQCLFCRRLTGQPGPCKYLHAVMILSFRTDRSEQTMQTQIILLLEEQSDQGPHCLLFHLHFIDQIP